MVQLSKENLLYVSDKPDIVMQSGKGMILKDHHGKSYLDFIGGWAVNVLGHSPKCMIRALKKQAKKLINASPSFYNKPMLEFADLLMKNSCFDRCFFMSTGAEANEGAIKLARKFGQVKKNGAYKIITTIGGFHGRTLATMSATGKQIWKDLFEPKVPGFVHVPLNNIEAMNSSIDEKTCAVMLETIQGEGGVNEATFEYIKQLRQLCNKTNTLLIFDEIQTGFGRTGTLFAYEHYDVEPDIITLGKGIGGGYPLSAMLLKEELNIFKPGEQGGTYTGQPLGMAVGLAILKEILKKDVLTHVNQMSVFVIESLKEMQKKYPIENIRGKGMLLAFDLKEGNAYQITKKCLEKGLIINAISDKTIRLIPPLIVKKKHILEMIAILKLFL